MSTLCTKDFTLTVKSGCLTPAIKNTYVVAGDDVTYGDSVDRLYVSNRATQEVYKVNPDTGAIITTRAMGFFEGNVYYEKVSDRLFFTYDNGAFDLHMIVLDLSTLATIQDFGHISNGIGDALCCFAYDSVRHRIWVLDHQPFLTVIDPFTGVVNSIDLTATIGNNGGVAYHPTRDKIVVSGESVALFPRESWFTVDPVTYALGTEFDSLAKFETAGGSLIYCAGNDRLYRQKGNTGLPPHVPAGLWKIELLAGSPFFVPTDLDYPDDPNYADGVCYNPACSRVVGFSSQGAAGQYFDINTDAFIADTGSFVGSPNLVHSVYDAKRANIWVKETTGTGRLYQFT